MNLICILNSYMSMHNIILQNIYISDDQYQIEETIDNVSGKLESFSLSDAIETSLNMQGMHAPVEEPRRGGLVHLMINKVQSDCSRQEVTTNSSTGVRVQCCPPGDGAAPLRPGG